MDMHEITTSFPTLAALVNQIDAKDPRYLWSRGIASVPPRPENLRAAFNHIRDGNDGVTATQLYSAIEKFGRETNVQKVSSRAQHGSAHLQFHYNSMSSICCVLT